MVAGPAVPHARAGTNPGAAALGWAEAHTLGLPYVYGAAGPASYDCSGLIMAATAAIGDGGLPHNTVAMIQSGRLIPTSSPQRGDLAFWGPPAAPTHVEFYISPGVTFGAHHTGTTIGDRTYGPGYTPSSFYTIR